MKARKKFQEIERTESSHLGQFMRSKKWKGFSAKTDIHQKNF